MHYTADWGNRITVTLLLLFSKHLSYHFDESLRCICDVSDSDATEMSPPQTLKNFTLWSGRANNMRPHSKCMREKLLPQTMWDKRESTKRNLSQATDLPSADVQHCFCTVGFLPMLSWSSLVIGRQKGCSSLWLVAQHPASSWLL